MLFIDLASLISWYFSPDFINIQNSAYVIDRKKISTSSYDLIGKCPVCYIYIYWRQTNWATFLGRFVLLNKAVSLNYSAIDANINTIIIISTRQNIDILQWINHTIIGDHGLTPNRIDYKSQITFAATCVESIIGRVASNLSYPVRLNNHAGHYHFLCLLSSYSSSSSFWLDSNILVSFNHFQCVFIVFIISKKHQNHQQCTVHHVWKSGERWIAPLKMLILQ